MPIDNFYKDFGHFLMRGWGQPALLRHDRRIIEQTVPGRELVAFAGCPQPRTAKDKMPNVYRNTAHRIMGRDMPLACVGAAG